MWQAATGAAPELRFRVDADELPATVYHMACLAGHIPCTRDVFERFWHGRLGWSAEDERELAVWKEAVSRVENAAPQPPGGPFIGNTASLFPAVEARYRLAAEALESRVPDVRLLRAVEHFRRRLRPWRRRETLDIDLKVVERKLRRRGMRSLAAKVADFVEAQPRAAVIHVHAIPSPEAASGRASGTWIANHVLVEVVSKTTPDELASVVLHEATHYLYDSASADKLAALREQFAGAAHGAAYYAFLNEALACAVQAQIPGSAGRDRYRHAYIPRLGRAAAPLLQEALARRSTLYQGFAGAYIGAAGRELGPDAAGLRFLLASAIFLPSEAGAAAYEAFLREFEPVAFLKTERWREFPRMNLVFLLAYADLPALAESFPELASHTGRRGFAYLAPGGGRESVCVVAGRDAAAVTDVVGKLATVRTASQGLLVSID